MKMTLDEAILHLKETLADPTHDWGCEECKVEHEQLLEWLEDYNQLKDDYIELDNRLRTANTENYELKRLLRLALESFDFISDNLIPYTESVCVCDFAMLRANPFDNCFNCPLSNAKHKYCKWRYYDEAMKLLDGDANEQDNYCMICGQRISTYKQICHECEVKYNINWGDNIAQKVQEYIQNIERGEKNDT